MYQGALQQFVEGDGMNHASKNGTDMFGALPASSSRVDPVEDEAMTLEAVELEFALGAIDVFVEGFDAALAKAAERVGGKVLFNMPAIDTSEAQRIGAIAIAAEPQDQVIFVTLRNDGTTLTIGTPEGGNIQFESLGHTYAAVMKSLTPKASSDSAKTGDE